MGDGPVGTRPLDADVPFAAASIEALAPIAADSGLARGTGRANRLGDCIHHPILAARPERVGGAPFAAQPRLFEPVAQEACVCYRNHALFDDEEVRMYGVAGDECAARSLEDIVPRSHGLRAAGATAKESVARFVPMARASAARPETRSPPPVSHNAALFAKADPAAEGLAGSAFDCPLRHRLGERP